MHGADILRKFGPGVLREVQKWLAMNGRSLMVKEAVKPIELNDVAEAIAVLKVYGIELDISRSQMPLWGNGRDSASDAAGAEQHPETTRR